MAIIVPRTPKTISAVLKNPTSGIALLFFEVTRSLRQFPLKPSERNLSGLS